MKAILAILIMLTMSQFAVAAEGTSTLSWEAPETRVDGTAMAVSEIKEYRAFYSIDSEPTTDSEFVVIDFAATTEDITLQLIPRAEPYTISFAIMTVDTQDRQSSLSNVVSKQFQVGSTSNPGVPTMLQFTISIADGFTITEVEGGISR